MESIVGSEDNRPVCKRCNLVLKDNLALESHTITCNRPQKGGSFNHMFAFGTAVIGNPTPAIIEENGDKFEPLSQPIPPLPQPEDYTQPQHFILMLIFVFVVEVSKRPEVWPGTDLTIRG